jgi:hypothetical protein
MVKSFADTHSDKTYEAKWAQQETIKSLAVAIDKEDEQFLMDLRAALPDCPTSSQELRWAKAVKCGSVLNLSYQS